MPKETCQKQIVYISLTSNAMKQLLIVYDLKLILFEYYDEENNQILLEIQKGTFLKKSSS